jgi:hypothetical protein
MAASTAAAASRDERVSEPEDRFRYERKFATQSLTPHLAESVVREHPALFRQAYPDRDVCNVYFDDLNLQSLKANLDGIPNRTKTRIRWYGEIRGLANKAQLEFKIKKGLVGTKEIYALAPIDTRSGQIEAAIAEQLRSSDLPEAVALRIRMQEPTLLNSYSRKYFLSADGRFRVTIDSNMRFYPARNPWKRRPAQHVGAIVVELKYARADNDTASAVAQKLLFRLSRSSKYVTGMNLLFGVSDFH